MIVPPSSIIIAEDSLITPDRGEIETLAIGVEVDIDKNPLSDLDPQADRIEPPI